MQTAAVADFHVANVADSQSPNSGSVARVNDVGWSESAITYANRPTSWGPNVAALGAVVRDSWVDVPVTSAVTTGGLLTLGIRTGDWDGAFYDSQRVRRGNRTTTRRHQRDTRHDDLVDIHDDLDNHHDGADRARRHRHAGAGCGCVHGCVDGGDELRVERTVGGGRVAGAGSVRAVRPVVIEWSGAEARVLRIHVANVADGQSPETGRAV